MQRSTLLAEATIPGSDRLLRLFQGKDDCSIVLSGVGELMSTRKHASEDALGRLPCEMLKSTECANVLIGGLGMGFTLAAALAATGPKSRITVAELVDEVIDWNRGPLGDYANNPLSDSRVTVFNGDVSDLLRKGGQRFDVVALDVDNGPEALSSTGNDWIYSKEGIRSARNSLSPGGVLAYWSASPDYAFANMLGNAGLHVTEKTVYAHGNKGTKHTILLATVGKRSALFPRKRG